MGTGVRRGAMAARSASRAVGDRRAGRSRLHLLHIGKTGGTALKAAFGGEDVVTASHRLVLHGHGFTLADVPDGERAVVVVRDPVARSGTSATRSPTTWATPPRSRPGGSPWPATSGTWPRSSPT